MQGSSPQGATLQRPFSKRLLGLGALLGLALLLAIGFALGEARGWPLLIQPLQTELTQRLGRSVQLVPVATPGTPDDKTAAPGSARLHFWGGLSLQTPWLQVGAPAWSQAPHLLQARDVEVQLRYIDAWRAWQGQQLLVHSLRASQLDVVLERRADGLASWQIQDRPDSSPAPAAPLLQTVNLSQGQLRYNDAKLGLEARAQAVLKDSQLKLQLQADAGRAHMEFDGHADDLAHWDRAQGTFTLQGPSMAAVGVPLGITLPTTGAFKAQGQLRHSDKLWDVVLSAVQVGSSRLTGHFIFDTRKPLPQLSGTLSGERLNLLDLGPALGAEPAAAHRRGRVLPSRPFDLASLRTMEADVAIAIGTVDLNTSRLAPLQPLNARLQLSQGLLSLSDLDARLGPGHIGGKLSLNGQQDRAHWVADLHWDGVALEQWIHQTRSKGLPPYVTGRAQGQASLRGRITATVQGGTVSHLLVEAGGLDMAESLGVMVQGDQPLRLDCAVADLTVAAGVARPQVLVLDTSDSTVWMDGSVSLASETLDLRAVVAPKDFSPLTLRTPLHVGGSFAAPQVSVEKGPLSLKLGSALLLGLINPLAALIPLVDTGSRDASQQEALACQAHLQQKLQGKLPQPALQRPAP
ncbi:hypothetical protein DIC66_08260 [Rhodoferax lacus]|uniref:AsmA domain-containing protein n=1 Tax=Rhodoferax lacus TaxID=2184758 RepID=A0A3E1RCP6_9BURK|nr:AsmA family protein [Rhodoferax lacus]RFO97129.1 hypothetical protein DIC66_08260 [Rhodoferax lacus]